jgi:hypothetical protein
VTTRSSCLTGFGPPAYRSRHASLHLALFAILLLLFTTPLASAPNDAGEKKKPEKPYALLIGTVWGPDDRPVYGVRVLIRRAPDKKARWELYSNHTGEFAQRLPAGKADYVVWADLKGFKSLDGTQLQPGPEVNVHIEFDERTDVGVHLK